LFASSSTVYGRGAAAPFVEDAPLGIPASPYGASKRAARSSDSRTISSLALHLWACDSSTCMGRGCGRKLALAVFTATRSSNARRCRSLATARSFAISRMSSDICRGIVAALTAPNIAGQCINLGHDQPIAIRRLIELIEQAAGVKALIEHRPPRAEDMPFTHADVTRLGDCWAISHAWKLSRASGEYVEWFRKHSWPSVGQTFVSAIIEW